jgi:hypothetical protein
VLDGYDKILIVEVWEKYKNIMQSVEKYILM